jgi:hypothetical protein
MELLVIAVFGVIVGSILNCVVEVLYAKFTGTFPFTTTTKISSSRHILP